VLWRHTFADFKSTSPGFGASASPLVDGTNVIVHVGGDDNGSLTAFDVTSGKITWQWRGDGPAYASPIITTLGGIRQLITQSQKHCLAISPADGKLIWKLPFTTSYEQNIVTPVVVDERVIFGGVNKPVFAVTLTGTEPATVWETNEIALYMSTPVLDGTTLYGMSTKQRGSLFSMNALTGAVLWKGEGRLGENASLTDIGPALLVMSDSGELSVHQKSGPTLKEVMKYKVADSPVWASPAVSGAQVVIKDKTRLTLYRVKS
jgi:outer membrane protein assembly factor BamB